MISWWIRFSHCSRIFYQLSSLIRMGVSLRPALVGMIADETNPYIKKSLEHCLADVDRGIRFQGAIQMLLPGRVNPFSHLPTIPDLGQFLETLAMYYDRQYQLTRSIIVQLIYPVIVSILGGLGLGVMILVVLPVYGSFFSSIGGEMPAGLRGILEIRQWILDHWMVGAIVLAGVASVVWPGRSRVAGWRPIQTQIVARLCWVMGVSLQSGVPLKSISVALKTMTGLPSCQNFCDRLAQTGELADSWRSAFGLSNRHYQLLVAGQSTGQLAEMVMQIGMEVQESAFNQLKWMGKLVPIGVMLGLAVIIFIGFYITLLPLLGLINQL